MCSGSDVGASLIRDKGILDTKAYEYEVCNFHSRSQLNTP